MATSEKFSIPQAAARLRLSYGKVYRMVLVGLLRGRQDSSGRWWVEGADVEKAGESDCWAGSPKRQRPPWRSQVKSEARGKPRGAEE
jgi:hypothetical protein